MTSFGIVYFSQYVIFLSKFFLCIRVGTLLIVARIHKCQFELNPSPFFAFKNMFLFLPFIQGIHYPCLFNRREQTKGTRNIRKSFVSVVNMTRGAFD